MKRFTDSDLWDEDWFLDLSNEEKLFWFYLKDKCNHAGIWRVNKRKFEFILGSTLSLDRFFEKSNVGKARIVKLDPEKWYIAGFIRFQYGGTLNMNNKVHKSIFDLLTNYNIDTSTFEVKEKSESPHGDLKMRSKDKDKEKDSKDSLKGKKGKFTPPTEDQVFKYFKEKCKDVTDEFARIEANKFIDYWEGHDWTDQATGEQVKVWKGRAATWKSWWNGKWPIAELAAEEKYQKLKGEFHKGDAGWIGITLEQNRFIYGHQHTGPSTHCNYPENELIVDPKSPKTLHQINIERGAA